MSSEHTLSPRTLWAQDKHQVFVTFEVFEAKEVTVEFEKNKIKFSAVQPDSNQKYSVEFDLFDEVKPEDCTQFYTPRAIKCCLEKANQGPFWPRLMKDKVKPHFLHVDFSRWVDEDYEDEDPEANNPMDPNMFMNLANGFGGEVSEYNDDTFVHQEDSSDDEEAKEFKDLPQLIAD